MVAIILGTICALFIWRGVMCSAPAPATPKCPDCGRPMAGLPRAAGGRCTLCADTAERR